jgi:hypothetical protein
MVASWIGQVRRAGSLGISLGAWYGEMGTEATAAIV